MKIAVLFHGLARGPHQELGTSFKNAFKDYEVTSYGHTWRLNPNAMTPSNCKPEVDFAPVDAQVLTEAFSFKRLVIEDQNSITVPGIEQIEHNVAKNAVKRLESLRKCFALLDSDYDVIVITRFDVVYNQKFIIEPVKPGIVHVPYVYNTREGKNILGKMKKENPDSVPGFIHDFIGYGSLETMRLYDKFRDEYINICKRYPLNTNPWLPDRALDIFLRIENNIKYQEFKLSHGLHRGTHVQRYC